MKTVPAQTRATAVAPALLAWYDRQRRDLPWRREASPYRTLVSEFMLQQTVVATVVPFFERFMARFPDVRALAVANEDDVVALWSGLGYYARARNLHRAARAVLSQHDGEIPDAEEVLRSLPGIGPYTAAAVAAIAFGRQTFALDGNAARVVARLAGVSAPIDKPATRDQLREIGLAAVPRRRSGDFAQAVMELGATVCAARAPACGTCPLAKVCVARRTGKTAEIPRKTVRPAKRLVRLVSLRLRQDGHVLLVRSPVGLLAGTWMLPTAVVAGKDAEEPAPEGGPARSDAGRAAPALSVAQALGAEWGVGARRIARVGEVRHLFTHRDVTVEVFAAPAVRAQPAFPRVVIAAGTDARREARWMDEGRLGDLAVSTFLRKQLALPKQVT